MTHPLGQPNIGRSSDPAENAAAENADPAENDPRHRHSAGAPLPQLPDGSTLVIYDQATVCAFFCAVLRRCGAVVRSALSVREGMRAVEEELPDIVLCDSAMPHEDGFSFVSWMLMQPRTLAVPVLAITAFGRPADEQRTMKAGLRGYIRKPVDPLELVHAVAAFAPADC